MDSQTLYDKVLFENEEKGMQLRLVLNEFRDIEYLHIRKYYLSFDEGHLPTKEGISMPASIQNVFALLDGLIEICAQEESLDSISTHFAQKISDLKNISD